jgi:hypothetical protein
MQAGRSYWAKNQIMVLAPADMASLPPSIITKKYIIFSKQPSLSAGTIPNLNLPCFISS